MMGEDKLTRLERLRLEAFAQVGARHQMRPISLHAHLIEATIVANFISATTQAEVDKAVASAAMQILDKGQQ